VKPLGGPTSPASGEEGLRGGAFVTGRWVARRRPGDPPGRRYRQDVARGRSAVFARAVQPACILWAIFVREPTPRYCIGMRVYANEFLVLCSL
jgi:hypothetical protein